MMTSPRPEARDEIWAQIPGYLWRYEASNLGCVREYRSMRLRKLSVMSKGYLTASLDGQTFRVHRLVLLAFVGPCPPGHQAGHLNGDKTDCGLLNLRWVTPEENEAQKAKHGTKAEGRRNGQVKLTEEAVREIRRRYRKGIRLAEEFGVSNDLIRQVVKRKVWAHVV